MYNLSLRDINTSILDTKLDWESKSSDAPLHDLYKLMHFVSCCDTEMRLAGGAVYDIIHGHVPKDYDIFFRFPREFEFGIGKRRMLLELLHPDFKVVSDLPGYEERGFERVVSLRHKGKFAYVVQLVDTGDIIPSEFISTSFDCDAMKLTYHPCMGTVFLDDAEVQLNSKRWVVDGQLTSWRHLCRLREKACFANASIVLEGATEEEVIKRHVKYHEEGSE